MTFRPWRQSTTTAASFWEPKNPRSGFARGIYETPENAYLEEVHNTLVNRAQRRCDMKRLSVLTMVLGMMLFALGCPPAEKTPQPSLDPMPPVDEAAGRAVGGAAPQREEGCRRRGSARQGGSETGAAEGTTPPLSTGRQTGCRPGRQTGRCRLPPGDKPADKPAAAPVKPADKPAATPADKPADKPAAAPVTSQRTNRLPLRPDAG